MHGWHCYIFKTYPLDKLSGLRTSGSRSVYQYHCRCYDTIEPVAINIKEAPIVHIAFLRQGLKAMSHEAIFSCNLQRNGVSSCILQKKSSPVTLLVCKIIRLQVIQRLAYVYKSTGACNIFFTQICVPKLQETIVSCDSALTLL